MKERIRRHTTNRLKTRGILGKGGEGRSLDGRTKGCSMIQEAVLPLVAGGELNTATTRSTATSREGRQAALSTTPGDGHGDALYVSRAPRQVRAIAGMLGGERVGKAIR